MTTSTASLVLDPARLDVSAQPRPAARPLAPSAVAPAVARISSQDLLAGAIEVQIEHHGALYRLRQTALGKLILTK